MPSIRIRLVLALGLLYPILGIGQSNVQQPDKILPYRKTEKGELTVHVFLPKGWNASDKRAGLLLFFGGGFRGGAPSAMYSKATYFASRGMVAVSADYRVKNTYGVGAEACFADARSAMRFVRSHAGELGIDPEKLLAGGGSSGRVMAASLAYGKGPDDPKDDKAISVQPAGLVLFNPAIVQSITLN
jgi:acetyl esterase